MQLAITKEEIGDDPFALAARARAFRQRMANFKPEPKPVSLPVVKFIAPPMREPEESAPKIYSGMVVGPVTQDSPHYEAFLIKFRKVTAADCIDYVCSVYGLTKSELLSARRYKNVCRPRQFAMWLAKSRTSLSLPEIGRRFGGRDHTTVLHAFRIMPSLIQAGEFTPPTHAEFCAVLGRFLNDPDAPADDASA